jgi:hypothetical protein
MLPGRLQQFVGATKQIDARSPQFVGGISRFESSMAVLTHHLTTEIFDAYLQTTAAGWAFLHEVR